MVFDNVINARVECPSNASVREASNAADPRRRDDAPSSGPLCREKSLRILCSLCLHWERKRRPQGRVHSSFRANHQHAKRVSINSKAQSDSFETGSVVTVGIRAALEATSASDIGIRQTGRGHSSTTTFPERDGSLLAK